MSLEITMVKMGDSLAPATSADRELLDNIKQGKGVKVKLVSMRDRSLEHHRLYWGGLVRLVADYWEPDARVISRYDKKIMGGLVDWVASKGKKTDALVELISLYLEDRAQTIKDRLPGNESVVRLQDVHEWLKDEAGYFDVKFTPTGIKKKLKSINFNSMSSQADFNEFYKRVFSVAWSYVLCRAGFKSEEEAMETAEKMIRMG